MKRMRFGGEDFKGFEGDLGQVPWTEDVEEPCCLCLRLDKHGRCDGTFKCPHIEDLKKGKITECVTY